MLKRILFTVVIILFFGACSSSNASSEMIEIDEIIFFANPISDSDYSMTTIDTLGTYMKEQLELRGYLIKDFSIKVATSQVMVAEAIVAGSAHIGMISAPNYLAFRKDGMFATLLTKKYATTLMDVEKTITNTNFPGKYIEGSLTGFDEAFLLLGPSELGRQLKEIVMRGERPSFDLLNQASWCVHNPTNLSGYIYPNQWLQTNYGKTIRDLKNVVKVNNTYEMMAALSFESCDISGTIAESWLRFDDIWNNDFENTSSMWEDLSVLASLGRVPYSVIAFTENSDVITEELSAHISQLMIEYIKTKEGQDFFNLYGIKGLQAYSEFDKELFKFTEDAIILSRNND